MQLLRRLFASLASQLAPELIQQKMQRLIVETVEPGASQHDGIDTARTFYKNILLVPKAFANNAFDAIALHRFAHVLFGDHQAKTRVIKNIRARENEYFFAGYPQCSSVKNLLEICGRQQTQCSGIAVARHCAESTPISRSADDDL